jgi:ATP-binding cassette subfamily C protein LapB
VDESPKNAPSEEKENTQRTDQNNKDQAKAVHKGSIFASKPKNARQKGAQEGKAQNPESGSEGSQNEQKPESRKPQAMSGWPLEADRLAMSQPLLEALKIVAGNHGRRVSINTLSAGLPIPVSGITPGLFVRAAERAQMNARLIERSLPALAINPILPCILVLDSGQCCIVEDVLYPKKQKPSRKKGQSAKLNVETMFRVVYPETPDQKRDIPVRELMRLYTGHLFVLTPIARSDDRAGPAAINEKRQWFKTPIAANKSIYWEVGIAAIMINLLALASPLFVMNVYDRVVPNNAFHTLFVLGAGITIAYIFDFILKNLRSNFLDIAGRRADIKISSNIFEHVLSMKLAERPASVGVLTSNMREFETIRDFFTSATLVSLIDMPFAFLFIVVIAIIGGPIAYVPLVAMPLVLIVGWLLQRSMMKIIQSTMAENALKNALLFETITGLETIKVQAAEGHAQRKWEELTEEAAKSSMKIKKISSYALNWAAFIQQMTSVGIIFVGVYLISEGNMTMGALIASVMLSGRALAPLGQAAALMTRLNQSVESYKNLDELMHKPIERPADRHFTSLDLVEGNIEFRGVTFHYPDQKIPAIDNLSLGIKPGDHVGIIGAVGSGKTTLQRLMMNLYEPSSGAILLDGVDVRQIDPGDLRRNIGVVQQKPQLFYGSVRENITMGHETAPERSVLRAAELSGVMEFLRETQYGLDTQVGERGDALSGGQQQAIAVARALLYDPPIMILDEPTASMDPASENKLLKRLHVLTKNRTVILITHKGSMLSLVDKLILMDRGRVLAYGPKGEIIERLRRNEFGGQSADHAREAERGSESPEG